CCRAALWSSPIWRMPSHISPKRSAVAGGQELARRMQSMR
ncbi:MAG: hypothetical protein AVDCRST_MAG15-587, partial [uncultured Rubellimicrobium sp.]